MFNFSGKNLKKKLRVNHRPFCFMMVAMLIFSMYACKDSSVSIDTLEPMGTVTGVVVDKSTSEPLEGVEITLAYVNPEQGEDEEEQENYTRTTDESGRFIFKDIPVNNNGNKFSFDLEDEDDEFSVGSSSNYSYSLTLDMSDLEGYRAYTVFDDIRLNFETTGGLVGGAGAAENLVSSVVLPIGKLNAGIKGKVLTSTTSEAVKDATVEAYLDGGYEGFDSAKDILIKSGTTDEAGRFQLNELDESSKIYLRINKELDSDNRINEKTSEYDLLASAGEEDPVLDIGDISITPINSASEFFITEVSMEDGSLEGDPSDIQFTFSFNKPVKQTSYTSTNQGFGVSSGTIIDDIVLEETGTRAKINGKYEISVSWNEDYDELTVTASEDLPDGYKFILDASTALDNLTDENDSALYFGTDASYTSLHDAGSIEFATDGNTNTPATPEIFAEFNEEVDYTGAPVELVSIIDEGEVDVAYVEIFQKIGDESFNRIAKVDDWFSDQIRFSTHTGLMVDSRSGGTNYDRSAKVKYKVRAVSINLRRSDFSDTITIEDVMGPEVLSAVYTTTGAPAGKAYVDIEFSEPMKFTSKDSELFDSSNYSFRDPSDETKDVTDVEIETYFFDSFTIRLEIPETAVNPGSDKVLVGPEITDISGNGVSQDGTDDEAVIN